VDIESTAGLGTTIRTKIPLTLAIIPALIVHCGGERYAIPQVSLLELVRVDTEQSARGIEYMQGAPVYRLRGTLLPLVFLDEQLQVESSRTSADALNIVVLQVEEQTFGLVVDSIRDAEEIVVKPLQKQLKGIGVFAGAAIMGDGRVALVLDVLGLAQRGQVITSGKSRALGEQERPPPSAASPGEPMLLFSGRVGNQMAIPLSMVARLEEIPYTKLECLRDTKVIQYRGEILPLIDISGDRDRFLLNSSADRREEAMVSEDESHELLSVIVVAREGQRVGLVVDRILDIVCGPTASSMQATTPGMAGTAILLERVTELLDVDALFHAAHLPAMN
jgi:two-component system chemotaxis sensor kinase CheA